MNKQAVTQPFDDRTDSFFEVLADWDTAMASRRKEPSISPESYVKFLFDPFQEAMRCRFGLLAAVVEDRLNVVCTNVSDPARLEGLLRYLPELFARAHATTRQTYSSSEQKDDIPPYVSSVMSVGPSPENGRSREFGMILWFLDRQEAAAPVTSGVQFSSFDELLVRLVLGHIVKYLETELRMRRGWFEATRESEQSREKRHAAQMVLEIESLIGFDTDDVVLVEWLDALRRAFVSNTGVRAPEFAAALVTAAELLKSVRGQDQEALVRKTFFECHLAYLTQERLLPLLSQRIKKAKELAGLEIEEPKS